ncbi:hypothetical protein OC846_003144 [Tilletia horrida]|uniref:Uncharacterized protein n=1 Tax=Tilletia horrida TaxID=155126 RepID=A0AAN6JS11_9BASI|nr:hypothetical protein OC845_003780 [Tilletia horrida]KAK0551858.1 hypothetical protein OC846_003144 [Tilletia horrida]KAK0561097.1 hypothetical protein OC861_005987 [Tilletia horrida]
MLMRSLATLLTLSALASAANLPRDDYVVVPGNGPYPDKVQLKVTQFKKIGRKQSTGKVVSKVDGNFPPFEIIHSRSDLDWDYGASTWGGSFSSMSQNGGVKGDWLLSKTNGTYSGEFDGEKFGASPKVQLVFGINKQITFEIDGNGANLDCERKSGERWTCTGLAGSA